MRELYSETSSSCLSLGNSGPAGVCGFMIEKVTIREQEGDLRSRRRGRAPAGILAWAFAVTSLISWRHSLLAVGRVPQFGGPSGAVPLQLSGEGRTLSLSETRRDVPLPGTWGTAFLIGYKILYYLITLLIIYSNCILSMYFPILSYFCTLISFSATYDLAVVVPRKTLISQSNPIPPTSETLPHHHPSLWPPLCEGRPECKDRSTKGSYQGFGVVGVEVAEARALEGQSALLLLRISSPQRPPRGGGGATGQRDMWMWPSVAFWH